MAFQLTKLVNKLNWLENFKANWTFHPLGMILVEGAQNQEPGEEPGIEAVSVAYSGFHKGRAKSWFPIFLPKGAMAP